MRRGKHGAGNACTANCQMHRDAEALTIAEQAGHLKLARDQQAGQADEGLPCEEQCQCTCECKEEVTIIATYWSCHLSVTVEIFKAPN